MKTDANRHCRIDREGHVLTITIDRPEVLNALHLPAHVELSRAFDLYAADPELRVAVVTGAGGRPGGGISGGNVEYRIRPVAPTISLNSSSMSVAKHHAPLP